MATAFACLFCCAVVTATAQESSQKVLTAGRSFVVKPAPRPVSSASSAGVVASASQGLVDELAGLRREMAERVKEIERVRLLDSALGAQLQTSLSELNARIKNAEIALTRADEREKERRESEKLKLLQEHESRMLDKQHQHQLDLIKMDKCFTEGPAPVVVGKDWFEQLADGMDACTSFEKGVKQLQSTDRTVQADGLRKISGAMRQASPVK